MSHAVQNFEIHAGDDLTLEVTVKDAAGVAVDITLASEIRWALSVSAATAALVTKTKTAAEIAITDGPGGVFEVTLAAADSAGLSGYHHHEADLTLGGKVTTVVHGRVGIAATVLN